MRLLARFKIPRLSNQQKMSWTYLCFRQTQLHGLRQFRQPVTIDGLIPIEWPLKADKKYIKPCFLSDSFSGFRLGPVNPTILSAFASRSDRKHDWQRSSAGSDSALSVGNVNDPGTGIVPAEREPALRHPILAGGFRGDLVERRTRISHLSRSAIDRTNRDGSASGQSRGVSENVATCLRQVSAFGT
jgi:hypothetical protein